MREARIHPETGKELHREEREQFVSIGSLTAAVKVPGWYPNDDSDSIHTGSDLKASNEAYKMLREKLPLHIKGIRTKRSLTQKEAGILIGGGPRAFQKYEKGQMPSAATLNLIEVIDKHPDVIETLRNLRLVASNEIVVSKKSGSFAKRAAATGKFTTVKSTVKGRSAGARKPSVRKGA